MRTAVNIYQRNIFRSQKLIFRPRIVQAADQPLLSTYIGTELKR